MNIQQWYLKTFRRSEIVRLIHTDVDKRISVKYILQTEKNKIQIGEKSFLLTHEKINYLEGIPTVFTNYKTAEPLDILDVQNTIYTPEKFNTAITAQVVKELFAATKMKKLQDISTMLSIGILLVCGYSLYMMMTKLDEIMNILQQLQTVGG